VTFAYPILLELDGRRAVVVGAGAVAAGKVEGLLAAGANVTVVSEGPKRALERLVGDPRVHLERRRFRPTDLDGATVCVAWSERIGERDEIRHAAHRYGVLLNVMDDVERCDFAAPAVVRRGDLLIAVSTGGRSPALARRLREELEQRFGEEWAGILRVLGEVREQTLRDIPDVGERAARWQEALDVAELQSLAREGRTEELRARLLGRLATKGAA